MPPIRRIWAVVKANAYGHGLLRAAQALADADGFALLDLNEAVRLREAGHHQADPAARGIIRAGRSAAGRRYGLTLVVHDLEQIAMLERARLSAAVAVCLKLNTGMNRLGFAGAQVRAAYARLQASGKIAADHADDAFRRRRRRRGVAAQMARFAEWTAGLEGEVTWPIRRRCCAIPQTHADWVRPGIMLYGCSPFADIRAQMRWVCSR